MPHSFIGGTAGAGAQEQVRRSLETTPTPRPWALSVQHQSPKEHSRVQEKSRVNLAWNWLSFSSRGRSFSMGGRMVILKGGRSAQDVG